MEEKLVGEKRKEKISEMRWEGVRYRLRKGGREIIHETSGRIGGGEMVALVGASGSGKTTLLKALARRYDRSTGVLEGRVLIDARLVSNSSMKKMSSFLRQEDFFFPFLTPREMLAFALSMLFHMQQHEKEKRISELLENLNLKTCADSKIGNSMVKGISGGEKRRLSLAVELLNDPSIIFLDEPTSGLDSFNALLVMSLLKQQAHRGTIVVCSLHQPSFEVLELVDRTIVLRDGYVLYDAPVHLLHAAVASLAAVAAPPDASPLDVLLRAVDPKKNEHAARNLDTLRSAVASNPLPADVQAATTTGGGGEDQGEVGEVKRWLILMGRGLMNMRRHKRLFLLFNMQLLFSCMLGVVIYFNMNRNYNIFSNDGIINMQNRIGSYFFITLNLYVGFLFNSAFKSAEEGMIVYKEISSGLYSSTSYFFAKLTTDFMFLFPALLIPCLAYFKLLHMRPELNELLLFFEFMVWVAVTGHAFGNLLGNLVKGGVKTITQLAPLFFVPFVLLSGFVVNSESLGFFSFLKWISPLKFALELALRGEFKDEPQAMALSETLGFKEGSTEDRRIIIGYALGASIIAYIIYFMRIRSFV